MNLTVVVLPNLWGAPVCVWVEPGAGGGAVWVCADLPAVTVGPGQRLLCFAVSNMRPGDQSALHRLLFMFYSEKRNFFPVLLLTRPPLLSALLLSDHMTQQVS